MTLMDKQDLLTQLVAHLSASAADAKLAMEAASIEAREGATAAEKREDSRVALEQSGLARGHHARLGRALADLATLEGFAPTATNIVVTGAIVEVETDDIGRTFFVAPVGAGIELSGPGGDGFLSVVTPSSPVGRAVMGCAVGDVVDIVVAGQSRAWTVSYVG
jgi:transcription elongation GreA/GreB family factor